MQNWYSQNSPVRSKGVAVGIGGIGVGGKLIVAFGIAARVAATACCICSSGLALGKVHAVEINNEQRIRQYRMSRLYSFSEQINGSYV